MNRFVTYFKVWSAAFMLVAGVALSVAGFAVSPVGENGYDLSFRDGKVVRISYEAQMRACFFEGFWFLFVIFASETINCT